MHPSVKLARAPLFRWLADGSLGYVAAASDLEVTLQRAQRCHLALQVAVVVRRCLQI